MKMLSVAIAVVVSVALVASSAFAFSCPTLVKAANESIAKAEPQAGMAAEDRQKARNQGMVEVAKDLVKGAEADHAGGKHAQSEAKAKAAKWLAEQVK